MKRYGRSMLSEDQVKWIVNAKLEGKLTNREIASVQGVSTRRVQQLYREYKSTGVIHVQKKAGRYKQPLPEQVKCEIIKLYKMYRANASYIGKILRAKEYSIDNNRINQILKEAGFAMSEPKKWHRKKWIRYEREYSLWHVDWYEI
ncbi:MAG: hypothetical protein RXR51_01850 [Nitrososphaeria archaeon]